MFYTSQILLASNHPGQDRVMIQLFGPSVVLAVADGAGGLSGGAEAAEMAIRFIQNRVGALASQPDFERLLTELDAAISNDRVAGEATCVVVAVNRNGIVGASVGDSGAWVVTTSGIDDLTKDQLRKPLLGTNCAVPVGFSRPALSGTLLVATDGLLKYTSRERIGAALAGADLDAVANSLVALVRYPSGALPDDIGIALCRTPR